MEDVTKFTEKILGYKTWSDKKKIDAILEYDCSLYTNLGSDSSKTERNEAKKKSRALYRAIKQIDKSDGEKLLWHMDKE